MSTLNSRVLHYGFLIFSCIIIVIFVGVSFSQKGVKKHDFQGKCGLCHVQIPPEGSAYKDIILKGEVSTLCSNCHTVERKMSHPVDVVPNKTGVMLSQFLDDNGKITCLTCHDVHKEEKNNYKADELKGFLRGHTRGRAFCLTCHNQSALGTNWRHDLVIPYVHASGKLSQSESGAILDKYSVECLSCHDGVISAASTVSIRAGDFKHGIGLSHPVGVNYQQANDFQPINSLPQEIKLFNGTVGCLSCHDPYSSKDDFLVIDNTASRLCLGCHRK